MSFISYLTYEEYLELGGTVSEDKFILYVRKAQRKLDYLTFDRIPLLTNIPDIVKECLAEMVNKLVLYEASTSGMTSASTYSNGIESIKFTDDAYSKFNDELVKTACMYLPDYLLARSVNFDVREYLQSDDNNP